MLNHRLETLREEIAFTARPKIHSHTQIFRYGRNIFCLPHRPNFSDIFDLSLHWVCPGIYFDQTFSTHLPNKQRGSNKWAGLYFYTYHVNKNNYFLYQLPTCSFPYVLYALHYRPRLVYFLPHFSLWFIL